MPISCPVALVRIIPVLAGFREAVTPVLADCSLMAEMAFDNPSEVLIAEILNEIDCPSAGAVGVFSDRNSKV
ncbi:hypothetical protein D3C71_1940750 [compost metagenome]